MSGRSLTIPLTALLIAEFVHIAATRLNDGQPAGDPASFGPRIHVAGLILTGAVLAWAAWGGRRAGLLAALSGAAVAAAAVSYHALPLDAPYTNGFRHGATAFQWTTVALGFGTGVWCLAVGLRRVRSGPERS